MDECALHQLWLSKGASGLNICIECMNVRNPVWRAATEITEGAFRPIHQGVELSEMRMSYKIGNSGDHRRACGNEAIVVTCGLRGKEKSFRLFEKPNGHFARPRITKHGGSCRAKHVRLGTQCAARSVPKTLSFSGFRSCYLRVVLEKSPRPIFKYGLGQFGSNGNTRVDETCSVANVAFRISRRRLQNAKC